MHVDGEPRIFWNNKWPLHPDIIVQLELQNPTLESQRAFLAQLEAEAQQAAWSLCTHVGGDHAEMIGCKECTSNPGDSVSLDPPDGCDAALRAERCERRCGTTS